MKVLLLDYTILDIYWGLLSQKEFSAILYDTPESRRACAATTILSKYPSRVCYYEEL